MSGIQISGLLANSAFDWKSVVDQLIEAEGIPMRKLNAEKETNTLKIDALAGLHTALTELQDAVQSIRAEGIFAGRTVSSDLAGTTWKSSSATGAGIGSYRFDVAQLATVAQQRGAADIGAGLAATADVSGLTLATLSTAAPVTAGTFTVSGARVTVALTDSLQDVFDAIAATTGGDVTAVYDPGADRITLTRAAGELVLGAGNDTSNFLAVMKLANTGTAAATSSAPLGAIATTAPLTSANLRSAITAVDSLGAGSFTVNGETIAYNVNTDTLGSVLSRINAAGAGVTASYDSANDRVVLVNKATGDTGIAVSEAAAGLLDALGLTAAGGGALVRGANAQFTVNGGATFSSSSNTLEAAAHGIAGLSVTVNSASAQTLQVESDTGLMQTAIERFMASFNAVQDLIEASTRITVTGATVSTAVLSDNREVQSWARELRALAFDAVSGLTGDVSRLDHLGIDFDSATGHLRVKDSGKLASALGDKPDDVQAFFLQPGTGIVSRFFSYLTKVSSADRAQQSNLGRANADLDAQIARLQSRLEQQREMLTSSFIRMLDAQSLAQSQNTYLTNAFFRDNSSN